MVIAKFSHPFISASDFSGWGNDDDDDDYDDEFEDALLIFHDPFPLLSIPLGRKDIAVHMYLDV